MTGFVVVSKDQLSEFNSPIYSKRERVSGVYKEMGEEEKDYSKVDLNRS